jgi:hypothetical protein
VYSDPAARTEWLRGAGFQPNLDIERRHNPPRKIRRDQHFSPSNRGTVDPGDADRGSRARLASFDGLAKAFK